MLIFILVYNYRQNAAAINATLNDVVAKTKQASIGDAQKTSSIRSQSRCTLLAAVAAEDPCGLQNGGEPGSAYRALTSARQIDAAYVSFEDGYHRVVTRIDDDRRRSDPKFHRRRTGIPAISMAFPARRDGVRHRTFFDTWPHVVGSYDVGAIEDIRALRGLPGGEGSSRASDRRGASAQSGHRLSGHHV